MSGTLSVAEVVAFAGVLVALLSVASFWIGFLIKSRGESSRRVHARMDHMDRTADEKYVTRRELNGQLRRIDEGIEVVRKQHGELRKDVAGLGKRFDDLIDSAKRIT